MWTKLSRFLRDFRTLAWPYWTSEERWRAYGLAAVVAVLTAAQVQLLVMVNTWYQQFYDGLQKYDETAFWPLIFKFSWIAGLYIVARIYSVYWRQSLEIGWRRWLTERYVGDWLEGQSYYRLPLQAAKTDNPDQRIAEDLRLFVKTTLDLTIDFGGTMGTLVSFSVILWGISGSWTVPGTSFVIPAYMFWAALLYAVAGTWLTHLVGRPLAKLSFSQQRYEADFRFGLVRVRENAEGVALYRGEADEARRLSRTFADVFTNWWALMRRTKKLGALTNGYSQAAMLFPFIVAAPRYFAKEIQLGGLMQISNAFRQVQDGLSWIVGSYQDLAGYKATIDRLISFRHALVKARTEDARAGIEVRTNGVEAVALRSLCLALPDGAALLRDVELKL